MSRQSPACFPRPTRPRSWCSWETPKRSASMTTMTVALGTSTPTSMTVVDTSTSISPRGNAGHHGVLVLRRHPAVEHLDGQPARAGLSRSVASTAYTLAISRGRRAPRPRPARRRRDRPRRRARPPRCRPAAPSSPMRGHTTYAWRPARTSSAMRSQVRCTQAGLSAGTTCVAIGRPPRGSSRRVEVSMSPNTVIATVRGIGVAVMTSTCGRLDCPCRAGHPAARRRTGAARRRPPARGRGTARAPGSARGSR